MNPVSVQWDTSMKMLYQAGISVKLFGFGKLNRVWKGVNKVC